MRIVAAQTMCRLMCCRALAPSICVGVANYLTHLYWHVGFCFLVVMQTANILSVGPVYLVTFLAWHCSLCQACLSSVFGSGYAKLFTSSLFHMPS